MTTIMNADDKHHYASLASLAAMMIAITTHRLHVKPGLPGHLKYILKNLKRQIITTIIRINYKHYYTSLASLAAMMGTTPSISSSDSISGRDNNVDSCHRPSRAPPPLGEGVGGFPARETSVCNASCDRHSRFSQLDGQLKARVGDQQLLELQDFPFF